MLKKICALLLCCTLAIGAVGCGNGGGGSNANGTDTLVIAITKDESSLTPFTYLTGSPGLEVMRLIYDSLYTFDKDNKVIPWMVKEATNDAEFKTFTISLKDGLKWHDGKPVTLEDVKFSYEYPATQASARWAKIAKRVKSMEIQGDKLVMNLNQSEPNFISESMADMPIMPKHIFEGVTDAKALAGTVGSGAYKLSEYVVDQKYVLTANPDYFAGKPKVKTINMPIIKDKTTIYQGIKNGEFDTFTDKLTSELMKTFENDSNLTLLTGNGYASNMFYMNNEVAPFDNAEFRNAVALAINDQDIVDRVFLGKADIGVAGVFTEASPFVKAGLKNTYDVTAANKKLDELGYNTKDANGIRLDKTGKKLSFEFLTPSDALKVRTAEIISEQLKAIGIETSIKSMDKDTLDTFVWPGFDVTQKRNYALSLWGWSAPTQLKEGATVELCSSDVKKGTLNISGYKNAEFDALATQYAETLDSAKRQELSYQMQDVAAKTTPFYTYAFQNVISVFNNKKYKDYVMMKGTGIINVFSFIDYKAN